VLRDSLPKIITELPGPKSRDVINKRNVEVPSAISCTTPCVISQGEGSMIEDIDGNIFMDWVGGIGVLNVGHSNSEVVKAVQMQAERYFHPQINTFHYKEYIELASVLNSITPGDFKKRTALFNSGAEAIENSIKIARKATGRSEVIAFSGAFHGRTFMAMTLTAGTTYKASFTPLVPGVHRVEFPNVYHANSIIAEDAIPDYYIEKLEDCFLESVPPNKVAAVILEPIQGEAGFIEPPIKYIEKLRNVCDKHGIVLIADEVQTGFCRTGKMFATDYWSEKNVYPDIIVTAKSMAGGLPISAVTAREEMMEALELGEIGGTYGGNPIACASALKVIEILQRDNYAEKARRIGELVMKRFKKWYGMYPCIGTYRGKGAMLSIEFVKDRESKMPAPEIASKILSECKKKGLILKVAGSHHQIVRLLMPLVANDEQIGAGLDIIESVIEETC